MRGERKPDLLAAGVELFSRNGYRDVSIEEVARRAGVGTGTFYTYFRGKEDFYEEILDEIEHQGRQEVDRLVASFQSPLNRLKALYRFGVLGIRSSPLLLGVMTGSKRYAFPGQTARRQRGDTLRTHIESKIGEILADGARTLEMRVGLFRNPRRLCVALFEATLLKLETENVEELMDDTLRLLERGLGRRLRAGRARREERRGPKPKRHGR